MVTYDYGKREEGEREGGWMGAGWNEYVFAGERMGRTGLRSRKTKMMTATGIRFEVT